MPRGRGRQLRRPRDLCRGIIFRRRTFATPAAPSKLFKFFRNIRIRLPALRGGYRQVIRTIFALFFVFVVLAVEFRSTLGFE
jgi:hypothetical protein